MTLLTRRAIRVLTLAVLASVCLFTVNVQAADEKAKPVDKKAEAKAKKDAAAKEKAATKEAKAKADADAKAKAKAEKPVVKDPAVAKAEKAMTEQDRSLPLGAITLGARKGDNEVEGYGDFLLPIARISSGLLFISPRATFSDNNEEEYNLGLGYRYLVPDRKVIVGGNVYYDYRSTAANNGFDQLGLGVEMLTEWVDARANYYLPEDKREVAREYDVATVSESSWNAGWGDPYAHNNAVLQDYIGPVKRIETLTQHYVEYEQALEGFDAEVGVKLPIPTVSDYADIKVFGGYYFFDAKFGGDDIKGFKGRLEVKAAQSIFLDAEVFEDKELYGSDYFVGARMVLPFSIQNFADGRNPFEGGAKGLRTSKEKSSFESRMTEMVMRDLHVQTEMSEAIEDITQRMETHVTKQLNKSPTNTTVLASDVTFVDGDNNTGIETGSAEHPYNTLGEGVGNAVGDTVYVWDSKDPYTENVDLPANLILWGSGCVMAGMDGKVFGNGIKPEVVGTAVGPTFNITGDDVTIRGFSITHDAIFSATPDVDPIYGYDIANVGIYGGNVTRTTIGCNEIFGCSLGVLLAADDVPIFEAAFRNNDVHDNANDGINITAGLGKVLKPSTSIDEAYVTFDGDTATGNGDDGFDINVGAIDTTLVTMKNVTSTGNDDDGVDLYLEAYDGGVVLTVDPSTFSGNGDDGVQAYLGAQYAVLANFAGVTANNNGEDGLDIETDSGGIGLVLIGPDASLMDLVTQAIGGDMPDVFEDFLAASGPVDVSGNGDDGIDLWMGSSFLSFAGIFDVTANNNGDDGMYGSVLANEFSALLMTPTETLMPLVGTGLDILDLLGLDLPVTMPTYNSYGPIQANGNGGGGIDFQVASGGSSLMMLMNAEANNNEDYAGVEFHIYGDDGIAAGLFADIHANGNGEDGIRGEIESYSGPSIGIFLDFEANDNDWDGLNVDILAHDNTALFAAASLNPVRTLLDMLNETDLLDMDITLPGTAFGPISTSGNGGDGMDVRVRGEGPAVGVVLDARANDNNGDGIKMDIRSQQSDGIGVVGSSDVLFELADSLIGLPTLQTALPEDFPAMGNVEANGNGGGGIRVRVEGGEPGVMVGMGGISANGNLGVGGDFNDGINVQLRSDYGPSDAFVGWVETSDNAGSGVTIKSDTEEDASVMVINAVANNNGGPGVKASVTSSLEEVEIFFGGISANSNGNRNVAISGAAGTNRARVVLMNIQANGSENLSGVGVDMQSPNGWIEVAAGSNSFAGYIDPEFAALVENGGIVANGNSENGVKFELNARDGISFIGNDITASRNGKDGLVVEAQSANGSVNGYLENVEANVNAKDGVDVWMSGSGAGVLNTLTASNVTANDNNAGVKLEVVAANGSAQGSALDVEADGNSGNGLAMRVVGLGVGGTALATVTDSSTDGNGSDGVNVQVQASALASFRGEGIDSHGNTVGVRVDANSGTAAYALDMGGGVLGSSGQGSIHGNANRDLRNAGGGTVMAENNYWGANPPLNSQFGGSVDRNPWLTSEPTP